MTPILQQAQIENYRMFQKFFVWPKNVRNAWSTTDTKTSRIFMWNINRLDKIRGQQPSQFGIEFTCFGDVFFLLHQGMIYWLNTAYIKSLSRPLWSPENTSLLLVALIVQSLYLPVWLTSAQIKYLVCPRMLCCNTNVYRCSLHRGTK
jgi:hypothetical protein